MRREDLHGFAPAVATPFDDAGEIMPDAFQELIDFLLARGATSICVAGDNGESWALSAEERGRLTALAKTRCGDRAKVVVGCSAPTLAASLGYARAAAENGADALLSMPQTYVLKASDDEIRRRFDGLAAAVASPIVLYNSPRRQGFSLSVDQIEALIDQGPVIGLKESQRDFFHHSHVLDRVSDRIAVMTGPCHYIMPSFALGAAGFIATGPEFISERPSALAEIARAAPGDRYRRAHRQLTGLYELLMSVGTWPAAFKAALNLCGLPAGVPRDPVAPLSSEAVDALRRAFDVLEIDPAAVRP